MDQLPTARKSAVITLARKREAYLLYKSGKPHAQIAIELGVSPRMIYRYIDEFDLVQFRQKEEAHNQAMSVLAGTATINQLVAVTAIKLKALRNI